jgi:pimeloyl-ACP methyl ester carboxylesterase
VPPRPQRHGPLGEPERGLDDAQLVGRLEVRTAEPQPSLQQDLAALELGAVAVDVGEQPLRPLVDVLLELRRRHDALLDRQTVRVSAYRTLELSVEGGALHVGVWPGDDGAPTVLAAHGITANHLSYAAIARRLGDDVTLVAPDLRGRGRSNAITGPFGITVHADDLVRVLDHLGLDRAVVVGHSMGAWVAATTATRHPDRVAAVVLIDGGYPLVANASGDTADISIDDVLAAVLGPALARLSMTFPDRAAYLDFWREHPAVGGAYWDDDIVAYVDHDLVGEPPSLRSSVNGDAIRADATEQLTVHAVGDAAAHLTCPTFRLFAARGLLDGDPLYPDAPRDEVVADTNHYTIAFDGPHGGAAVVADTIRKAVAAS